MSQYGYTVYCVDISDSVTPRFMLCVV